MNMAAGPGVQFCKLLLLTLWLATSVYLSEATEHNYPVIAKRDTEALRKLLKVTPEDEWTAEEKKLKGEIDTVRAAEAILESDLENVRDEPVDRMMLEGEIEAMEDLESDLIEQEELIKQTRDNRNPTEIEDSEYSEEDYSEESQDYSEQSQDYSKESQDYSKESQDYSEESQDYSEESQDYSEESQDYSKESQDYSEESQDYSEESQDYSEESQDYSKESQDYSEESQDYSEESQDYSEESQDYSKESQDYSEESQDYSEESQDYSEESQDYSEESQEDDSDSYENRDKRQTQRNFLTHRPVYKKKRQTSTANSIQILRGYVNRLFSRIKFLEPAERKMKYQIELLVKKITELKSTKGLLNTTGEKTKLLEKLGAELKDIRQMVDDQNRQLDNQHRELKATQRKLEQRAKSFGSQVTRVKSVQAAQKRVQKKVESLKKNAVIVQTAQRHIKHGLHILQKQINVRPTSTVPTSSGTKSTIVSKPGPPEKKQDSKEPKNALLKKLNIAEHRKPTVESNKPTTVDTSALLNKLSDTNKVKVHADSKGKRDTLILSLEQRVFDGVQYAKSEEGLSTTEAESLIKDAESLEQKESDIVEQLLTDPQAENRLDPVIAKRDTEALRKLLRVTPEDEWTVEGKKLKGEIDTVRAAEAILESDLEYVRDEPVDRMMLEDEIEAMEDLESDLVEQEELIKQTRDNRNPTEIEDSEYSEEDYSEESQDYSEESQDYSKESQDYSEEIQDYSEGSQDYSEESQDYSEESEGDDSDYYEYKENRDKRHAKRKAHNWWKQRPMNAPTPTENSITSLKKDITNLSQHVIKRKETALEKMKQQIDLLVKNVTELKSMKTSPIEKLSAEVKNVRWKVDDHDRYLDKQGRELKAIQKKLEEQTKSIGSQVARVKSVQAAQKQVKKKMETLRNSAANVQSAQKHLKHDLKVLQKQINERPTSTAPTSSGTKAPAKVEKLGCHYQEPDPPEKKRDVHQDYSEESQEDDSDYYENRDKRLHPSWTHMYEKKRLTAKTLAGLKQQLYKVLSPRIKAMNTAQYRMKPRIELLLKRVSEIKSMTAAPKTTEEQTKLLEKLGAELKDTRQKVDDQNRQLDKQNRELKAAQRKIEEQAKSFGTRVKSIQSAQKQVQKKIESLRKNAANVQSAQKHLKHDLSKLSDTNKVKVHAGTKSKRDTLFLSLEQRVFDGVQHAKSEEGLSTTEAESLIKDAESLEQKESDIVDQLLKDPQAENRLDDIETRIVLRQQLQELITNLENELSQTNERSDRSAASTSDEGKSASWSVAHKVAHKQLETKSKRSTDDQRLIEERAAHAHHKKHHHSSHKADGHKDSHKASSNRAQGHKDSHKASSNRAQGHKDSHKASSNRAQGHKDSHKASCNRAQGHKDSHETSANKAQGHKDMDRCDRCEAMVGEEVCGCNGKTYNSLCHAVNCAGLTEDDITVGSCDLNDVCAGVQCDKGTTCVPISNGVCLTIYSNQKHKRLQCRQYMCVSEGKCSSDAHTQVCGKNGQTYPSLCYLHKSGVQLAYSGMCRPKLCRGYACGRDGVTYPSACHARAHGVRVDYPGKCFAESEFPALHGCDEVVRAGRCPKLACEGFVRPRDSCCPVCGGGLVVHPDTKTMAALVSTWKDVNHVYVIENFLRKLLSDTATKHCELSATLTNAGNVSVVLEAVIPKDSRVCQDRAKALAKEINGHYPAVEDSMLRPMAKTAALFDPMGYVQDKLTKTHKKVESTVKEKAKQGEKYANKKAENVQNYADREAARLEAEQMNSAPCHSVTALGLVALCCIVQYII